jgi:replicative DNA helicase
MSDLLKQINTISNDNYNDIIKIKQDSTLKLVTKNDPDLQSVDLSNALSELRPEIKRLKTGIKEIDQLFNTFVNGNLMTGIPAKDIILLSGMSGIGKTTLAFTIFTNLYRDHIKAAFFSFDMKEDQTMDAFRNALSGYKATAEEHMENIAIIGNKPVIICRREQISISRIDAYLTKTPRDIIFIDYFDKLESDQIHKSDKERYSQIMQSLKQLVDKHNCSLVLLIQGNEDKGYKFGRPTLMNVYGGKEVRSEADHILAVYRRSKLDDNLDARFNNVTEVIGLKLRSHAVKNVALIKLENGKMLDLPWGEADDYDRSGKKK